MRNRPSGSCRRRRSWAYGADAHTPVDAARDLAWAGPDDPGDWRPGAGVHAYSEALRAQLDGTGVEVCELVPPAVATRPEAKQRNPRALDLADFATEVMDLLRADPTPHEILVKAVLMHRWAERDGSYDELVAQRSKALAMLPGHQ